MNKRRSILKHPISTIKDDIQEDNRYSLQSSMHISICVFIITFVLSFIFSIPKCIKQYYWIFQMLILLFVCASGFIVIGTVYSELKNDDVWIDTSSKNRIKIYGLVLKMIGLYSIFILGIFKVFSNKIMTSFYMSFIVLSCAVSISIIVHELRYYLPVNAYTKWIYINIPAQNIKDENGNKINISKQHIRAKMDKK